MLHNPQSLKKILISRFFSGPQILFPLFSEKNCTFRQKMEFLPYLQLQDEIIVFLYFYQRNKRERAKKTIIVGLDVVMRGGRIQFTNYFISDRFVGILISLYYRSVCGEAYCSPWCQGLFESLLPQVFSGSRTDDLDRTDNPKYLDGKDNIDFLGRIDDL